MCWTGAACWCIRGGPLPVECIARGYMAGSAWEECRFTGRFTDHQRGIIFTHEAVREWESKLAPLLSETLRIQGRFFIVLGPLLSTVCMSLIGVAANAALVGVMLLMAGIGSAAFHVQAVAAAGAVSGDRKGFGIAVWSAGRSPMLGVVRR